ncbi:Zinc finger, FYVE/PHD-type [Quillaja saponaria]|nr:Zinc finger, FYVE/PHD-type [Quillaja saponaria]
MRVYLKEIPEDWVCDSCLPNHDVVLPHSGGNGDFVRHLKSDPSVQVHEDSHHHFLKRPRHVSTGKVKFIPTEEVIKLSLGVSTKESPSCSSFGSKPVRVNSRAIMSRRTPVGTRTLPPKISSARVKLIPSGHRRPPRSGGVQVSSMVNQKAPQTLLRERKAPVDPVKKRDCREQSQGFLRPANKVETFKASIQKPRDKVSRFSSRSTTRACISTAEKMALVAPRREYMHERQQQVDEMIPVKPVDALIPVKDVETLKIHIEKATTKCTPMSPARICSPAAVSGDTFCAVAECNKSTVKERELLDVLPKLKLYHPYLPSLHATWKGGFKIVDTSRPGTFFGGFQALPPCRVHRKAYEFSQKMPPVVQVEPVLQFNLLADIFQKNCPDLQEIALYFFHSDRIERSKKNYDSLCEFMNAQNLMLRGYINGVELLVFTSKQLNVDSQDTVAVVKSKAEYFIWGVFRHVKNDQPVVKLPEEPHFLISSSEHASNDDYIGMGKCEVIDMDVDMVGGKEVERVDLLLKNPSRSLSIFPGEGIIPKSLLKKLDEKASSITKDLDKPIKHLLLESKEFTEKIRSEFAFDLHPARSLGTVTNDQDHMDVPPGFQGKSRPKPRDVR